MDQQRLEEQMESYEENHEGFLSIWNYETNQHDNTEKKLGVDEWLNIVSNLSFYIISIWIFFFASDKDDFFMALAIPSP